MVGPKMAAPPKAQRVPFTPPPAPPTLEEVLEKGLTQPDLLIRFVDAHPDRFTRPDTPPDVVKILAPMLLRVNRTFEAEQMLAAGVKAAPDNGELQLSWGRVLLALGRRPAAIKALEQATRLLPDQAEAHFALARAYLERRPYDDALLQKSISTFERTLEIAPSFKSTDGATAADLYFEIGMAYARMSRRTKETAQGMKSAWERSLALDPDFKPQSNPEVDARQIRQVVADLERQIAE